VSNFVSVTASIAALAHGEKSRTQSLTQHYLIPRELKLSLWKNEVTDSDFANKSIHGVVNWTVTHTAHH